mmetsp:Transcript_73150/g.237918  ORF Transcript_73150/g.237918 Transcript_73150/m.237918 type:complete len:246 (+) Transcript_73150:113-850(+)
MACHEPMPPLESCAEHTRPEQVPTLAANGLTIRCPNEVDERPRKQRSCLTSVRRNTHQYSAIPTMLRPRLNAESSAGRIEAPKFCPVAAASRFTSEVTSVHSVTGAAASYQTPPPNKWKAAAKEVPPSKTICIRIGGLLRAQGSAGNLSRLAERSPGAREPGFEVASRGDDMAMACALPEQLGEQQTHLGLRVPEQCRIRREENPGPLLVRGSRVASKNVRQCCSRVALDLRDGFPQGLHFLTHI